MPVPSGNNAVAGKSVDSPITWLYKAWDSWTNSNITVWANVTISVIFNLDLPRQPQPPCTHVTTNQPPNPNTNVRTVIEEVGATNVAIVSGGGLQVSFHKEILAARSSVFADMLEIEVMETDPWTISIPEMTEKGVRALRTYLYFGETSEAKFHSGIAFELFECGYKYNIQNLKEAMLKILLDGNIVWLGVATALRLFLFVRNVAAWEELKAKTVHILKT